MRTHAEVAVAGQGLDRAWVRLASGEEIGGSALIGADGLHSQVRKTVVGDAMPRVAGHTTYRAVIPVDAMPEDLRWNAATLWAGPRCHLVHYPLSDWTAFNLVVTCHNDAKQPISGESVASDEVLAGFSHIHPVPQQLIAAASEWKRWVLCDREPVATWSDCRITLLGDAAHPTLQYLAQGACMAMEDAVVLAAEVAATPHDVVAAFVRYQDRRSLRTARVVLQSRQVGEHIYHPDGVHAAVRNQIMGAKSTEEWFDVMGWLYDATDLKSAIAQLEGALA